VRAIHPDADAVRHILPQRGWVPAGQGGAAPALHPVAATNAWVSQENRRVKFVIFYQKSTMYGELRRTS
jgi:hypothetical protein